MQLYKIHTFFVVANSLEQAKEAVKDNLPASYFSESVCPVDVIAVEQPHAPDALLKSTKMIDSINELVEQLVELGAIQRR